MRVAILIAFVCGTTLLAVGPAHAQQARSAAPARESKELVAVLDLEAVGSSAVEASAMSDQLRADLLKSGQYALVDRQQMDNVFKEQAFQQTGCTSSECAVQVGKVLGVRKLITGRITKIDSQHWLLSANVIDVETAETLRSETLPFEGAYFDLLTKGIGRLGAALAGKPAGAARPPAAVAAAPAGMGDGWTVRSPMPTPRWGAAGAELDGSIYVIGGWDGKTKFYSTVEVYDPALNTWSTRPEMPSARARIAAVSFQGKIYVFGGQRFQDSYVTDLVEAYDPARNAWQSRADMPSGRSNMGIAVLNDRVWLVGGWNKSAKSDVQIYDPRTNKWSEGAALPTPRGGPRAAVVNGILYVFGGYEQNFRNPTDRVDAYDPAKQKWESRSRMPRSAGSMAPVVMNGRVYLIGGNVGKSLPPFIQIYNPADDTWTTEPAKTGREMATAAVVNNVAYIIGGNRGGPLALAEAYVPPVK